MTCLLEQERNPFKCDWGIAVRWSLEITEQWGWTQNQASWVKGEKGGGAAAYAFRAGKGGS